MRRGARLASKAGLSLNCRNMGDLNKACRGPASVTEPADSRPSSSDSGFFTGIACVFSCPGGASRQPARESPSCSFTASEPSESQTSCLGNHLRSKAAVAHVQVTQPTDLLAPCETMTATTATAMTATTASLPSRSEHLPASMTPLETLQPEVPDVQPQAQAETAPTAPIFREARVGSGPQPSRPQPTRSQAPPGNSADTATPRYEVQPTAKAKDSAIEET